MNIKKLLLLCISVLSFAIVMAKTNSQKVEDLPYAQSDIIRCKECGFWDADPSCSAFPDLHVCRYWLRITTEVDDFCSKAERKDNG